MAIPKWGKFNINPFRTLPRELHGEVRTRLLADVTNVFFEPSMFEVRWSDDFEHIYVQRESGLLHFGFESALREHAPLFDDGHHHLIFHRSNPGANFLLQAIRDVVEGTE